MSWANNNFVPEGKHFAPPKPNVKSIAALSETSYHGLPQIPYNAQTLVLEYLSGKKTKAITYYPRNLMEVLRLDHELNRSFTTKKREAELKEVQNMLTAQALHREEEYARQLQAEELNRKNRFFREKTTLSTESMKEFRKKLNLSAARKKSRARRGKYFKSTKGKTQKKNRN
jgi:hypothetical protein